VMQLVVFFLLIVQLLVGLNATITFHAERNDAFIVTSGQ